MKDVLTLITKMSGLGYLLIFIAFLGCIGPGVLVIFHYRPDVFLEADTVKLVLLSFSLDAPFVFMAMYFFIAESTSKQRIQSPATGLLIGCYSATFILHAAIFLAVIFNLSFMWYLGFAIGLSFLLGAIITFPRELIRRKSTISPDNSSPQ